MAPLATDMNGYLLSSISMRTGRVGNTRCHGKFGLSSTTTLPCISRIWTPTSWRVFWRIVSAIVSFSQRGMFTNASQVQHCYDDINENDWFQHLVIFSDVDDMVRSLAPITRISRLLVGKRSWRDWLVHVKGPEHIRFLRYRY